MACRRGVIQITSQRELGALFIGSRARDCWTWWMGYIALHLRDFWVIPILIVASAGQKKVIRWKHVKYGGRKLLVLAVGVHL